MHLLLPSVVLILGSSAGATFETLAGEAFYRERMALPPGAELVVSLVDISPADAASVELATIRVKPPGQVPIAFELRYDTALVEPRRSYAVQANLEIDGEVWFRSTTVHPVFREESDQPLRVLMERTMQEAKDQGALLDELIGTEWLAEDLANKGVVDRAQTTLAFDAERRIFGSTGCNRYSGGIDVVDGALTVGPLASTKKACPPAVMEQEDRFFSVVASAAELRLDGPYLYLLSADSEPLARFTRMN